MKYRRLRSDELAELEQQFVQFLVSNTVTGSDWEKLKQNEPDKAEKLIEVFSDIVFEQTIEKIEFLEYKTPIDIKIFHCQADKIIMMGLTVNGETTLDFTQNLSSDEMIQQFQQSGANLQLYSAEKAYSPSRDMELFKMMESGCLVTNESLFKTLEQLKKN